MAPDPHFRVKILRDLADEGPKTAYSLAMTHGSYIYAAMREMIRLGHVAHLGKSEGYTITADEAESSYRGFYTITDLDIELDTQGLIIGGSFKCSDLDFTLDGRMFPLTK